MSQSSISVIIPVYKDDMTLAALLQNLRDMDVAEIIIADGEDRANTPPYIDAVLSKDIIAKLTWIAAAPKGRGSQIHVGITCAASDYICVLHADSRLDARASNAIRTTLAKSLTSLGTFTLKFDTNSLALSIFAWISRADSALTTFGDQGFFFRRADYAGLDLDLSQYPLLEDVALRHAFKGLGRVTRSPVPIVTSARRFAKRGVWATQIFNTQILWRYMRGESPSSLYSAYYKAPDETSQTSQSQTALST